MDRPLAEAESELQEALGQVASFAPDRDEVKAASPRRPASRRRRVEPLRALPPPPRRGRRRPRPAADAAASRHEPAARPPDAARHRGRPANVAAVERAVEQVRSAAPADSPELTRDELPLADYDHMTLGSLRGRMRSLSVEQLVEVRAYEKAHADRLPIMTMLDNRIAKLSLTGTAAAATPATPASPA